MASLFTFDPDPPRVSSPWQAVVQRSPSDGRGQISSALVDEESFTEKQGGQTELTPSSDGLAVTRLEAEPQEGPTEYKLHLLLRPRRSFATVSTAGRIAGSQHGRQSPRTSTRSGTDATSGAQQHQQQAQQLQPSTSRQHRLEQLTTQLLWRLQQSSPYHSSAADNLILPSLPEATPALDVPAQPAKLLPGLEESQGALYEIGVSDDGTFVGLSKDEMEESLNNLRAMAGALGCSVEVLRMVAVGDCAWYEDAFPGSTLHKSKLFVAEAYIRPGVYLSRKHGKPSVASSQHDSLPTRGLIAGDGQADSAPSSVEAPEDPPQREQLRISLTGATTSGKSTLLGTLTTSILDNGRGKSRLSLLKHRHEIASGMTSSLAQELIGYVSAGDASSLSLEVVNYATESTWTDIHTSSAPGRLVFLSDVAGHPRYARTAIRGLVACDPHWMMLCISAHERHAQAHVSEFEDADADGVPFSGANAHLSMVYLDLCLNLGLPLIVVVTKLDATSKDSLRQILSNLLSRLKSAGRQPRMLSIGSPLSAEEDLQHVLSGDLAEVKQITSDGACIAPHSDVPIVLTSAVSGAGVGKLHALLQSLPIPSRHSSKDEAEYLTDEDNDSPPVLFYIDDVFNLPVSRGPALLDSKAGSDAQGFVISGLLARGSVSVGDELTLGPFSPNASAPGYDSDVRSSVPDDSFLSPRSFTDALTRVTTSPKLRVNPFEKEWHAVKVVSVRNLRLPVRFLKEDQAGTIGVVPLDDVLGPNALSVRKGMILASAGLEGIHSFTATFSVEHASSFVVGSPTVAYCASMRASAKIIAIALDESIPSTTPDSQAGDADEAFSFDLEDGSSRDDTYLRSFDSIRVTFQFMTHRQWLEIGAKVLIMPGGGQGLHQATERGTKGIGGLEGFVGRVVEKFSGGKHA